MKPTKHCSKTGEEGNGNIIKGVKKTHLKSRERTQLGLHYNLTYRVEIENCMSSL
jgi:hypothetical protein